MLLGFLRQMPMLVIIVGAITFPCDYSITTVTIVQFTNPLELDLKRKKLKIQ